MHILGLIAVAVAAAAFFLPFLESGEQGLSLFQISGETPGVNYVFIISWVLIAGMLACALTDDLPGLAPLAFLYCVYPTYAYHNSGHLLADVEVPAAFPPFAGAPAAFGYYLLFVAAYVAIAIGIVDGLRRRRRPVEVVA